MFNHTYMPHFIYSFVYGRVGCFYLLAIVNSAAMNMGVQLSLQDLAFNSFVWGEGGLLDHMVILYLIFFFEKPSYCFLSGCTILHSYQHAQGF